ncbi:MAG: manganese efflux pump [Fusobacterium sp.]|nr:manganese efflux pump [Fusobacterium sp.]
MSFINIFFTALALSMDAMSLAIIHGICSKNNSKLFWKISLTFGFFQFFMTFIGFLTGNLFIHKLSFYFKYISFGIFLLLGLMMIRESFTEDDEKIECSTDNDLSFITLFLMGLATSIDALLIGFTFSLFPHTEVFTYSIFIGIVTFLFSALAFLLGSKFGNILGKHPNIIGGILLIFISINILL